MKKSFSGFYSPSAIKIKNAWKHEKTLFIFDTNVLLNLYSYTEEARNDFFKTLDSISDKVWLPNHVGLEYQRNRLQVIKTEKYIFKKFEKYLENIENSLNNANFKELKLDKRFPELHTKAEELHISIQDSLSNFKKLVEKQNKKQPDVRSGDKIRKQLEEYFDNKIGNSFIEQNKLDELYKEGKNRYENNIPPGYKDAKTKKEDKEFTYGGLNYIPMYGDLIIWKQIIEQAKSSDIKSVFFVTDDTKEDWWYIIDSSGEKRIGTRAELREEIERESKISFFEILTTSSFMEDGKKYLELDVSAESIEEVEEKSRTVTIKLSDLQKQSLPELQLFNDELSKELKNVANNRSLHQYAEEMTKLSNQFSTSQNSAIQNAMRNFKENEEKIKQDIRRTLDMYKDMNLFPRF